MCTTHDIISGFIAIESEVRTPPGAKKVVHHSRYYFRVHRKVQVLPRRRRDLRTRGSHISRGRVAAGVSWRAPRKAHARAGGTARITPARTLARTTTRPRHAACKNASSRAPRQARARAHARVHSGNPPEPRVARPARGARAHACVHPTSAPIGATANWRSTSLKARTSSADIASRPGSRARSQTGWVRGSLASTRGPLIWARPKNIARGAGFEPRATSAPPDPHAPTLDTVPGPPPWFPKIYQRGSPRQALSACVISGNQEGVTRLQARQRVRADAAATKRKQGR